MSMTVTTAVTSATTDSTTAVLLALIAGLPVKSARATDSIIAQDLIAAAKTIDGGGQNVP